jgi:hypothetical protein
MPSQTTSEAALADLARAGRQGDPLHR